MPRNKKIKNNYREMKKLIDQYEYYLKHDKKKLSTIFIKNETEYKVLKNDISVMENRYPSLKNSLVVRLMRPAKMDGGSYSGTIKSVTEQVPHGPGIMSFDNGCTLEGEFKDGKLNGKGKFSSVKEDGKFKDDNLYNYEGEFKDGFFSGFGIWYNNFQKYEGEFLKDSRHGKGKITCLTDTKDNKKGTVFEGMFINGKANEDKKIKITYPDGTIETT